MARYTVAGPPHIHAEVLRRILDEIRRSVGRRAAEPSPTQPTQPARKPGAQAALRAGNLRDALAELAQELSAGADTPELQRLLMAGLVDLARRNQDAGTHEKIAFLLGTAMLSKDDVAGAELCARARDGARGLDMQAYRIEPSLPDWCRRAGLPVLDVPGWEVQPMSPGAPVPETGTAAFACALRPGRVLGTSFIPATADGVAFTERCIHRPDKVGQFEANEVVDTVQLGTANRLLVGSRGTDRHAGVHVLLGSSDNAGHWLLNYFSRLPMVQAVPGIESARFLVGPDVRPMQLDCLARAGIPAERVLRLAPGRIAEFEELWVPAMPYGFVGGPVLCLAPAVFGYIRRTLQLEFSRPRTRRVFLSRAAARWRRLINESAVLAEIADLGFEVVDPGMLTLAQQIELAATAQVIAGPMGAGMNLLLFAAEGTPVVTIKGPVKGMMDIDPFLTRELKQPYFPVVGTSLPNHPDPLRRDIEATPSLVREAMLQAISATTQRR